MLKVGQPDVKVWLIGKDLILGMIEGRRRRDDRGWDGCMASLTQWTWFEQALGAGNGQGSLECCSPWSCKESNMTKELNWTELKSKCKCTLLSRVQLFVTPCTIWSMEFSRPEYWSGSPLPSPGDRLTQGSNPGLPHCRQILYQLSQKGSPRILQWVTYPFSTRSSQPRNWTRVSCIAGRFFTNWAIREINVNIAFNVPWVSLTLLICFPFFPFILLCSSISTICLPAQFCSPASFNLPLIPVVYFSFQFL